MRTIVEMSDRSTVRPAALLGLALGGVLVGHALTYRVLVPDAHARTVELAETGHGYLGGANVVGMLAVIVALSILFLGRLVRRDGDVPRAIGRLVAFQLTTFVAMEILERLGSGDGVHQLMPVLVVGLPVQVMVAAIVAVVVRFTLRAATIVADRGAGEAVARSFGAIALPGLPTAAPLLAPATGAPPGRAPPFVR